MKTAVVSLTKKGAGLAFKIGIQLNADVYMKAEYLGSYNECETEGGKYDEVRVFAVEKDFTSFAGRLFGEYNSLVFVMACGIVVRAIAPYIRDKRVDPAVVVVDEAGKFAISLLSGHIGGANSLAAEVAEITGGAAVITTATDVNGMLAFDVFAKENDCAIENFGLLKNISAQLVNGGKIDIHTDYRLDGIIPDNIRVYNRGRDRGRSYETIDSILCDVEPSPITRPADTDKVIHSPAVVISNSLDIEEPLKSSLILRPRNLILGIGCRKGVSKERIGKAVSEFLEYNRKSKLSVKCMATIGLKSNEPGILGFCSESGLPLNILPVDIIAENEGKFEASPFVKEKVGVSSVAEPCAVLSGKDARLICGKTKYDGITLALAEEEKVLKL